MNTSGLIGSGGQNPNLQRPAQKLGFESLRASTSERALPSEHLRARPGQRPFALLVAALVCATCHVARPSNGYHSSPIRATGTAGERNWFFEAYAGAWETADTQQALTHSCAQGRTACLKARQPAYSMHCGEADCGPGSLCACGAEGVMLAPAEYARLESAHIGAP